MSDIIAHMLMALALGVIGIFMALRACIHQRQGNLIGAAASGITAITLGVLAMSLFGQGNAP